MRHSLSGGFALTNLGSYAEYNFFIDSMKHSIVIGTYEFLFAGGERADSNYIGYRNFLKDEPSGGFIGGGYFQTNFRNGADTLFGVNSAAPDAPKDFFAQGAYFEQGVRLRYKHAIVTFQYKAGVNLGYSVTTEFATSPLFIQAGVALGLGI